MRERVLKVVMVVAGLLLWRGDSVGDVFLEGPWRGDDHEHLCDASAWGCFC